MSFNKEKHLSANIEAIKLCFQLEKEKRSPTPEETKALKQYSGFGALKCILNPVETLSDIAHWPNSEVELFPLVAELHDTTKEELEIGAAIQTIFGQPEKLHSDRFLYTSRACSGFSRNIK